MANRRRGEVGLDLDGRRFILCLTLGGLAELEESFAVVDLGALGERFATGRLSGRDLLALLAIGLRGGGHMLSDAEIEALPLAGNMPAIAGAVADMLAMAFGDGAGEGAEPHQNPPRREA